jgi:hypothetical protein
MGINCSPFGCSIIEVYENQKSLGSPLSASHKMGKMAFCQWGLQPLFNILHLRMFMF